MRRIGRIKHSRIQLRQSRVTGTSGVQDANRKGYKVISISLYADQADLVDQATRELLHAGYPKANRSFVIQAAIQRLGEDLEGKNPAEVLRYFFERHVRRPLARITQPETTGPQARVDPSAGAER